MPPPNMLHPEDKERAKDLAKRLGTEIPKDIDHFMWSLPLLEKIVEILDTYRESIPMEDLNETD